MASRIISVSCIMPTTALLIHKTRSCLIHLYHISSDERPAARYGPAEAGREQWRWPPASFRTRAEYPSVAPTSRCGVFSLSVDKPSFIVGIPTTPMLSALQVFFVCRERSLWRTTTKSIPPGNKTVDLRPSRQNDFV